MALGHFTSLSICTRACELRLGHIKESYPSLISSRPRPPTVSVVRDRLTHSLRQTTCAEDVCSVATGLSRAPKWQYECASWARAAATARPARATVPKSEPDRKSSSLVHPCAFVFSFRALRGVTCPKRCHMKTQPPNTHICLIAFRGTSFITRCFPTFSTSCTLKYHHQGAWTVPCKWPPQ